MEFDNSAPNMDIPMAYQTPQEHLDNNTPIVTTVNSTSEMEVEEHSEGFQPVEAPSMENGNKTSLEEGSINPISALASRPIDVSSAAHDLSPLDRVGLIQIPKKQPHPYDNSPPQFPSGSFNSLSTEAQESEKAFAVSAPPFFSDAQNKNMLSHHKSIHKSYSTPIMSKQMDKAMDSLSTSISQSPKSMSIGQTSSSYSQFSNLSLGIGQNKLDMDFSVPSLSSSLNKQVPETSLDSFRNSRAISLRIVDDMMEKINVDVPLCVPKTRWTSSENNLSLTRARKFPRTDGQVNSFPNRPVAQVAKNVVLGRGTGSISLNTTTISSLKQFAKAKAEAQAKAYTEAQAEIKAVNEASFENSSPQIFKTENLPNSDYPLLNPAPHIKTIFNIDARTIEFINTKINKVEKSIQISSLHFDRKFVDQPIIFSVEENEAKFGMASLSSTVTKESTSLKSWKGFKKFFGRTKNLSRTKREQVIA